MTKYYLNSLRSSDALTREIRELIPDMNLRRRMSRVVRMGVTTALESLDDFGAEVDAVITATGLGCIGDSEKFLQNLLDEEEQRLNPTPFIQSTFNTVGAQIALIRGLRGYNNTFSHRYTGFESALIDAMMRLDGGEACAVLVEVFDERTESVERVMQRLHEAPKGTWGEGAVAMVLTAQPTPRSVAEITMPQFTPTQIAADAIRATAVVGDRPWHGAMAVALAEAVRRGGESEVVNDMEGRVHSLIYCKCGRWD